MIAGALLLLAGVAILMGIITAESYYPPGYHTATSEISDLGATRPPGSVTYQPSGTIFNATMIITGLMLMGAAFFTCRTFRRKLVTFPIMLLGLGVFGVGIFPGNNGDIHPWFAMMAFVFGGLAATASAKVTAGPFRYIVVVLGTITLVTLLTAGIWIEHIGDGGTERWVAYPVVLWMTAFGGYLLANGNTQDRKR